jgi:hypothetical protein
MGTQTGRPNVIPPEPVEPTPEFPFSIDKWEKDTGKTLKINKVTNDKITFSTPVREESNYPRKNDGGPINGRCYLYNEQGQGGFFDWIRPNQQWRDFKNVHSGYCDSGWRKLKKGQKIFMFITDIHDKRMGQVAEGVVQ